MKNAEATNFSFIEAVLLRPQMYTTSGTYAETIAFLEGYFSGLAKGDPYAVPVAEWTSFRSRLSQELQTSSDEAFGKFRELYTDDETALVEARNRAGRLRAEPQGK